MTKFVFSIFSICFLFIFMSCSSGDSQKTAENTTQPEVSQQETIEPREAPAFYIENLKSLYENVQNPIIANFRGVSIGDYYHLTFEDAEGKIYDFGDAQNETSGFQLEKDYSEGGEDTVDLNGNEGNPTYLGKTFRIHWEWKSNVFLCCEGEYEETKAEIPTIVKLELVD